MTLLRKAEGEKKQEKEEAGLGEGVRELLLTVLCLAQRRSGLSSESAPRKPCQVPPALKDQPNSSHLFPFP